MHIEFIKQHRAILLSISSLPCFKFELIFTFVLASKGLKKHIISTFFGII